MSVSKFAKLLFQFLPIILVATAIFISLPIIKPFFISLIIAYFLEHCSFFLVKKFGISQRTAKITVFLLFFILIFAAFLWLIPVIVHYIILFLGNSPNYITSVISEINVAIKSINPNFSLENVLFSSQKTLIEAPSITNSISLISSYLTNFAQQIIKSSLSIINIFSLLFLIPILTFYLLQEWQKIITNIVAIIPNILQNNIKEIANEIDHVLVKYVFAQIKVCLILACFYGFALHFARLEFGLLIGFLTGFFSFIPFVAIIIGFFSAIILAIFDWGVNFPYLFLISGIFIFGQFVEGNFITPKIIGEKIGLHPLWIIFGLFFFGSIFGFGGVVFAMPLTAISSVLIKHYWLLHLRNSQ